METEATAYLAAIVESSGDAIVSKDLNGTVRSFNAAAERMFGYRASEVIGRSVTVLIPPHLHDEEQEILGRIRRGERIDHYETVRITKDGRLIDVSLTVSPVRDRTGAIIGASKIARDITEEKRAAAALAEQQEWLRMAAAERERLLRDERAARAEAERANRIKDDFVAMISHELRTPLNAILGWTDLLRNQNGDRKTLEHGLEVIARNTRLQSQLISDLLDVSRIVSGKLSLELERVDLAYVVRNSVEALQGIAAEKGVELTVDLAHDLMPTAGDPARLHQIVWNLLSNAIKFTPSGGHVTIALRRVNDDAEIAVTDTGIGIRADFLPDLFERFRQASALTTRRHGGLGLGLSIAKHLAELHGGSIRAASAGEDKGSTFTVALPLMSPERAQDLARRLQQRRNAAVEAGQVSLQGIRVVVVEDDQDTRDLISRLLEAHRAEVVIAANAPEALELVVAARPHLIVCDIGLPDVDGYELIRRIRRLDGTVGKTPAVALTAFARYEDRTKALAAGFNAHLAKPVEPAELVITLGSFVNLIPARRKR